MDASPLLAGARLPELNDGDTYVNLHTYVHTYMHVCTQELGDITYIYYDYRCTYLCNSSVSHTQGGKLLSVSG